MSIKKVFILIGSCFSPSGNNLLRVTLIAGLILFTITAASLTCFYLIDRNNYKLVRQEDNFFRLLGEYDTSAGIFVGTEMEFEKLSRELDKMEKLTLSVESWLSVIKRRRALAYRYPRAMSNYHNSIAKAQKAYPFSQPIAAIAASAIVKDKALNSDENTKLRAILGVLQDTSFNSLRLGIHVLLGDFANPQTAAALPEDISADGNESIIQDLAVMKVLRQDYRGALADIQVTLNSFPRPSDNFMFFAGEYFYDFGDLRRAAEIFSRIEGDLPLIRQADSLYLAGLENNARSLWITLTNTAKGSYLDHSLYNMAVTSRSTGEAMTFLERLTQSEPTSVTESRQFGLIRYSRFLDRQKALYFLKNDPILKPDENPYIDLEITRRSIELQETGRQIAEAWILLDKHFENEDLYKWAAWLMAFQRYQNEINILLKRTENFQFSEWLSFYKAYLLMNEGDLENAEIILREIIADNAQWHYHANLGRILESQRSISRALEQYEIALFMAANPKTESRIYQYIARCQSALGRILEAHEALEDAIDADPDNMSARTDLERLGY